MSSQLAVKLRAARQAAQLTQAQVAQHVGVTRGAVTQWESKDPETRTQPSLDLLRKFAEITGVPFTWLIEEKFKAADVHHARNLYRAGQWDDIPVRVENINAPFRRATVIKPIGAVLHVNEETTELYERKPDEYAPPRLAQLFWSAVQFQLCNERPELERHFEVPLRKGGLTIRADYFTGRAVVEFAGAPATHASLLIRRKLGELALMEKIVGHPLRKALLLWSSSGEPVSVDLVAMADAVDVELLTLRDPKEAAEYLAALPQD